MSEKQNILDLTNLSKDHTLLLNSISKEITTDFHSLIEDIYEKTDKSIHWIVNSVVSRNNYFSNLFVDLCFLELTKVLLQTESFAQIIVPSRRLKNAITEHLNEKSVSINVLVDEKFISRFKNILKPFKNFVHNILMSIGLIFNSNRRRKETYNELGNGLILVDTWITQPEVKDDKYVARHYVKNDFWEKIDPEIQINTVFLPEFSLGPQDLLRGRLRHAIKTLSKADERFLFKHDYLTIRDYFFALLSPFSIKKIDFSSILFRGTNIGSLLRYDFYYHIGQHVSFLGLLNYRFFRRLRNSKIKIDKIINWFENQPVDKGFNYGANLFFPETELIGFQNFIIAYDYCIFTQPTIYEEKLNVIPPTVAVIGKEIIPILKKFNPNLKVILAPGFRFSHLNERSINNKANSILVALPVDVMVSEFILKICYSSIFSVPNINIWIKPHPDTNIKYLMDSNKEVFKKAKIANGSVEDYLALSRVLIATGTTVCLEALAYGIPTCVIASNSNLNQNPIPSSIDQRIWRLCYDAKDLIDAVNKFLSYSATDLDILHEIGMEVKNNYFEPVTKIKVREFLQIKNS